MNQEKQIEKWLEEQIINHEQAQKMLSDVRKTKKEEKSNKIIITLSTIGAVFLGIGAMLFIATNWQVITDPVKILLALFATFITYYFGYLFKYQKQNLPKVGSSLLFLGAILFGVTVMLIAQIYHINANAHSLVLVWLLGIAPLIYGFKSQAITTLSAFLFLLWVGLFIFRNQFISESIFLSMPVIYVLTGTLLFSIGGLHYFLKDFSKIARIFRLIGIKIAMLSLFLLTFRIFSGHNDLYWVRPAAGFFELPSSVGFGIVLFLIISVIGLIINLFFNPSKSKNNSYENGIALGALLFTMTFFFIPIENDLYNFLFNIIFAGLTGFIIYAGYERSDISLVNTGVFWLSIFVLAKYFDLFWGRMEISLFFLVGGLILVLGGIALEKKRREIKEEFKKIDT